MGLMTVNENNFKRIASIMPSLHPIEACLVVFGSDQGSLPGPATLTVDPVICPEIAPDRRVPVAIKTPLKKELGTLCEKGIITPVDKPTEWVSNIVVAQKKSGDLRVCINPQEASSCTPERTLSVAGTGGTATRTSWGQSFLDSGP